LGIEGFEEAKAKAFIREGTRRGTKEGMRSRDEAVPAEGKTRWSGGAPLTTRSGAHAAVFFQIVFFVILQFRSPCPRLARFLAEP